MKNFFLKILLIVFIVLFLTSCNNNKLDNEIKSLESELIIANEKIEADKLIIDEQRNQINKLQQEINESLLDENIDYYSGAMWSGQHVMYSDYIKVMLQRIFYPNEYFYIAPNNAKIDENPIANLQGNITFNRKMIGIRFINPINSLVSQFPRDIQEVWFLINEEKNYMYLLTKNNIWYSYDMSDDYLKYEFNILSAILNSYIDYELEQSSSKEIRLPLEGKNVFDPKSIKVGDRVQDFILTEIQVFPGTSDYPIDMLSAKFEGKVALTGDLFYIEQDGEFVFDDYIKFKPDKQSQLKLPISHHEPEGRYIVFVNQAEAISLAKIKPGESRLNVTIEIEDYTINYLPTDAENTAKLLNINSM